MAKLPFIPRLCNSIVKRVGPYRVIKQQDKKSSKFVVADYWENRYATGSNSGVGSYGRLSLFKAEIINDFIKKMDIESVLEFGCGDGHQLSLAAYPLYTGLDIAPSSIATCVDKFKDDPTKTFLVYEGKRAKTRADCTLSLDVIYHLVEDCIYEEYMSDLFHSATKYVIIYSSNVNWKACEHVMHRKFTDWVDSNCPQWILHQHIPNKYPYNTKDPDNTSFSDFYIYKLGSD
jgi:SAM-dependent methyltransferase